MLKPDIIGWLVIFKTINVNTVVCTRRKRDEFIQDIQDIFDIIGRLVLGGLDVYMHV